MGAGFPGNDHALLPEVIIFDKVDKTDKAIEVAALCDNITHWKREINARIREVGRRI